MMTPTRLAPPNGGMTEIYVPPPPSPDLPDRARQRAIVSRRPVPLAELRCYPIDPHRSNCRMCLRDSGDLVLAAALEHWLFLWIVDVPRAEVHTRIAWPLGAWLSKRCELTFDQDTLWVIAHHNLIRISCVDWDVQSCRCFRDFVPEGAIIEDSMMIAGSFYLWVRTSLPEAIFVIDVRTWELRRHLDGNYSSMVLVQGSEPLVCVTDWDDDSVFHYQDGRPVPGSVPMDYLMYSLARAPHGPGLMTLELEEDPEALLEINDMILRHLLPDGSGSYTYVDALTRRVIEGGSHIGTYQFFVSEDLAYVVVHLNRRERDKHLLAVSVSRRTGALSVRYRVLVPHDLRLAQDARSRRVVAIFTDERSLRAMPLGRERPSFDHLPGILYDRGYLTIPKVRLRDIRWCGEPIGEDLRNRAYPLSSEIEAMSHADRRNFIGHYKAGFHDDVEELADLYRALDIAALVQSDEVREDFEKEREDIARILREEHSESPVAALLMADRAALAGRWDAVKRWLHLVRPEHFDDPRRGHVLHLLGLVKTHEGRPDEAYEIFSKAARYESRHCRCDLGDLRLLTRPMASPPAADEWDGRQPLLRQLIGALRTSDDRRTRGDDEAALAALDDPVFWQTGEIQVAARQAEIFLDRPDDGVDLFHKRFILASFRDVLRNRLHRHEICLPGVTWNRDRIERIDKQARSWLYEVGDGGCGLMCDSR